MSPEGMISNESLSTPRRPDEWIANEGNEYSSYLSDTCPLILLSSGSGTPINFALQASVNSDALGTVK